MTVHAEPFQCSTKVSVGALGFADPTAVQSVALKHDTAWSAVAVDPAGDGGFAAVQDVPFHWSTTIAPAVVVPTATQKEVPMHDTPDNVGTVLEDGVLATGVHVFPFHCSMKLESTPCCVPTATQNVDVVHDTASMSDCTDPGGDPGGVGTTPVQLVAFAVGSGAVPAAPAGAPLSAKKARVERENRKAAQRTARFMAAPCMGGPRGELGRE